MSAIDQKLKAIESKIKDRVEERKNPDIPVNQEWKKVSGKRFINMIEDTILLLEYQKLELAKKAEDITKLLALQETEKQNRRRNKI